MRIRAAVILTVVVATLGMTAAPAPAAPYALVFTGNATTSGTWVPVSPNCGGFITCPAANSWSLSGSGTRVYVSDGFNNPQAVTISGSGTFNGWCGSSQGQGIVTISGIGSGLVSWNAFGATFVLSGMVGGHSLIAVLLVVPIRPGGDCVTSPATTFLVAGAVTGA